jgi:hypothetical protein
LSTASPPELEVANLDEVLARVAAGAECHVGIRQNRHQPLRALGQMAFAVLAAVERRLTARAASPAGSICSRGRTARSRTSPSKSVRRSRR